MTSNGSRAFLASLGLALGAAVLVACASPSNRTDAASPTAQNPTAEPALAARDAQASPAASPAASSKRSTAALPQCEGGRKLCREEDFAKAHGSNAPSRGTWIRVADQRGYLVLPQDARAPLPAILAFHSARGLNENIRLWSERLAEEGYAVLALDLYEGKVASTDAEAVALRDQANTRVGQIVSLVKEAYAMLTTDERVQAKRVALVGWSFGGAWATYLSTELPAVAAVVSYAGNAIGDAATAGRIKAPILMIRGSEDHLFDAAKAAAFQQRLRDAHKQVEFIEVDGGHALADPSRDGYSEAGDSQAFAHVRRFLAEHLAP